MQYHEAPRWSWRGPRPEGCAVAFGETLSDSSSPTLRFHRVESGETLSGIAEKFYGDERLGELLYYANEERIHHDRGLRPGQILYIPLA